ncbi:hypothetical protein PAESOLCIP111_01052 [Paenibacillus solanacearum]|uniref:SRPBCC family protein n=1 Tax=Paenibacillus solanacearum TaxID=2048548 RepID=A0A916JVP3_9BACL|nr:SRPBCC family protein [Paenibacillus solanacearum]CAG7608338.1 hypothetical protein PAESOLCIP111_01052 [Paenibacillus solanacearum]
MATIQREIEIACSLDKAWVQLREFGNAAQLFAGVLVDCQEDSGKRTVTFSNGYVVQEQLVTLDEEMHRLVYTVMNGGFTHHSASMQLLETAGGVRFVWTSDFLPDEAAPRVEPLVEAGCQAIQRSLQSL